MKSAIQINKIYLFIDNMQPYLKNFTSYKRMYVMKMFLQKNAAHVFYVISFRNIQTVHIFINLSKFSYLQIIKKIFSYRFQFVINVVLTKHSHQHFSYHSQHTIPHCVRLKWVEYRVENYDTISIRFGNVSLSNTSIIQKNIKFDFTNDERVVEEPTSSSSNGSNTIM